jgi:hypothetical protein
MTWIADAHLGDLDARHLTPTYRQSREVLPKWKSLCRISRFARHALYRHSSTFHPGSVPATFQSDAPLFAIAAFCVPAFRWGFGWFPRLLRGSPLSLSTILSGTSEHIVQCSDSFDLPECRRAFGSVHWKCPNVNSNWLVHWPCLAAWHSHLVIARSRHLWMFQL